MQGGQLIHLGQRALVSLFQSHLAKNKSFSTTNRANVCSDIPILSDIPNDITSSTTMEVSPTVSVSIPQHHNHPVMIDNTTIQADLFTTNNSFTVTETVINASVQNEQQSSSAVPPTTCEINGNINGVTTAVTTPFVVSQRKKPTTRRRTSSSQKKSHIPRQRAVQESELNSTSLSLSSSSSSSDIVLSSSLVMCDTLPQITSSPNKVIDSGLSPKEKVSPCVIKDGYKWRKYGQKIVKGCDHPRHYYRCVVSGCPAKKQVEKITCNSVALGAAGNESNIWYRYVWRGDHIHPPAKLSKLAVTDQEQFKQQILHVFDRTMNNEANNPSHNAQMGSTQQQQPSTNCFLNVGESLNLHHKETGLHSVSGSKTTKKEGRSSAGSKGPRRMEFRLVVECSANVDWSDDGFRWRKYGQKNLKGSTCPRSYYRCTESECSVRKQVEPTPHGANIITYFGFHPHPAPSHNNTHHLISPHPGYTPILGVSDKQNKRRKLSNSTEQNVDSVFCIAQAPLLALANCSLSGNTFAVDPNSVTQIASAICTNPK
eukprot:TRINITY_DN4223_c0_g1_i1.p1 TRINITY_DN4223_c0_g1~~TRINITY_DN4223_c0_g1_i1.p1  ORF type:complete len:542 (+),score=75.76 TRINITY_DN4223_c0_g1_i1:162-1787(+)